MAWAVAAVEPVIFPKCCLGFSCPPCFSSPPADARRCAGLEGQCWGQCCSQGFPPCSPACQHASSESNSCHHRNWVQGFAGKTWELARPRHKLPGQATSSPSPVLAEGGMWMHRKHQGSQPRVMPAMGWHFTYHLPWGMRHHDPSPLRMLWVLSVCRGIKPALQQGFCSTDRL